MLINSKKPKLNSFLIAVIFIVSGITLFVLSVFFGSQIISIIGLGLIFWGALFLLIPPPKHVEASFLITSSLPDYLTIDRMLKYLVSKNEAYNIPPCPRDIYLPEHLEGLKEMVTFIPAEYTDGIAEIEDIARGEFLIEKPRGLLIASPGVGLLDKIEQNHKIDFTKIPFSEIEETLLDFLNELYLAKEIQITINENEIILRIHDSLYKNLYSQKNNLKSINLLGCPLINTAACAIAKSVGKPTMIQEIKTTPNGNTTTATFKIINRTFEKRQKLIVDNEKISLRRNELLEVINASILIVDLSFDILIGLQKKQINWQLLENYSKDFGEIFSFKGQSIPSLKVDFSKILSAIQSQIPRVISEEANNILNVIYCYFEGLNLDDDFKESIPNFLSTKSIILSYYTLNDLLLGKIIGDKENKKEKYHLESVLHILTNSTGFNVEIEKLIASIDRVFPENDLESVVDTTREIFKEPLQRPSSLYSWSERKNQL